MVSNCDFITNAALGILHQHAQRPGQFDGALKREPVTAAFTTAELTRNIFDFSSQVLEPAMSVLAAQIRRRRRNATLKQNWSFVTIEGPQFYELGYDDAP